MIDYWGLIIRTNKYAGNFERDLCAHCTGQIGECGVGGDYVTDKNSDFFEDQIISISDEDGCSRPCSIWNLESESDYTSVIIYFENKPTQEAIDIIRERCGTFLDAVRERDEYNFKNLEGFEILWFKLLKSETIEEELDV